MTANTIIASVVTAGSNNHATVSEEANAYATDWVSQGIVGTLSNTAGVAPATGGFAVNADGTPDMGVTVSAGAAYVTGTPTAQGSQVLRARATASYTAYVINANASGSTKFDWIYLQLSATNAANPAAAADNVITLLTSRSTSSVTDNGTPPTYGTLLSVVTVTNGASVINNADISDRRTQSALSIPSTPLSTGWGNGLGSITAVTYNGNRSYSLTTATDNTGTISPGYRLRTTRSVLAPTQSTSLNGTNQYYNKTSPTGTTFTNNFVVSAWVKLTSYLGTNMAVVSRFNGTSGWELRVANTTGQIQLLGYNAGAANFSLVQSYQSVPLNKWIHITAQLDMSTFTATPTTSYVMLDGIDIPASVSRGGTNPTALVQAGDINIGASSATAFFPGKIAQAAIFNAKVTQATIRGYVSQGLAGTETSLISAYSFNNSIVDLNAGSGNNLSAQGAAVATNADSPFGGQAGGTISSTLDYAIVQTISSTTVVVQVGEGNTIPTTGGVASFSYANVREPYGFPGQRVKWRVNCYYINNSGNFTITASGVWTSTILNNFTIPIGEWVYGYQGAFQLHTSTSRLISGFFTLATATPTTNIFNGDMVTRPTFVGANATDMLCQLYRQSNISLSVATPVILYAASDDAVATVSYALRGDQGPIEIYAENAYL